MKVQNMVLHLLTSLSVYTDKDAEDKFPINFFNFLRINNLLKIDVPYNPFADTISTSSILEILKVIGRINLSCGRIFEGHLNAVQLLKSFANPLQQEKWSKDITEQKLFGVWNTQGKDGVQITDLGDGTYRLTGSKTFCSGANFIQRPLITAEWINSSRQGWQMIILNDQSTKQIKCDADFWKPLGMKASVSYRMTLQVLW